MSESSVLRSLKAFYLTNLIDRPIYAHELVPVGMVWACRWCGDLGEEGTSCPVPFAYRTAYRSLYR